MHWCFILLAAALIGWETTAASEEAKVEQPIAVIKSFYDGLKSDAKIHDLPEIFSGISDLAPDLRSANAAEYSGLTDVEVIWAFLRAHREAFLFEGIRPEKTLEKARIGYVFFSFSSPETFFDGGFGVEISLPLSKKAKEGVYKQVTFPMQKVESSSGVGYKLDVVSIRINGALLDFSGEFDRRSDLWKLIGLRDGQRQEAANNCECP